MPACLHCMPAMRSQHVHEVPGHRQRLCMCTLRPSLSRRALAAFISRRQSRASALLSDASTCASRLAASTCPRGTYYFRFAPGSGFAALPVQRTLLCPVVLQAPDDNGVHGSKKACGDVLQEPYLCKPCICGNTESIM